MTWLTARTPLGPARETSSQSTVMTVEAVDASVIQDDAMLETPVDDLGLQLEADASTLAFQDWSFDFANVVKRAGSLFPFLTGSLALDRIAVATQPSRDRRLTNPFGRERAALSLPPLVLSDAALQDIVDRSWSRRDRWRPFQQLAPFLDRHDANDGRLSDLIRGYATQNGLQPYTDVSIRDPRLWTQLGLVADQRDFISLISKYASRHPSSRATTELLFLLEQMAQGSMEALFALIDTDPQKHLQWTRDTNQPAYDAIVKIRQHYLDELARRHLGSFDAIRAYYDDARLWILGTIIERTPGGYRESDARFLSGAILWRARRTREAVAMWSEMKADPADRYFEACGQVLSTLPIQENGRIDRILDQERARWILFSSDRLRRFGYRFDRF